MDVLAKRKWLFAAGALVVGGYVVAWGCAVWGENYPAVIVLLRAGLLTLALTWVALGVWWLRHVKTFTVRSMVFGGPLLIAVLAVPLPYYSHGRSVQASLQNAGVQYRVQAAGFSQTLQQVTSEVLAIDSPNLFAAQLTYVGIDLAKVRPEQLLKLGKQPDLMAVRIVKSDINQHLTDPIVQWIDLLPQHTHVTLSLFKPNDQDLLKLKSIKRTLQEVHVYNNPLAPAALETVLQCQPEKAAFYDLDFPPSFGSVNDSTSHNRLKEIRLHLCRFNGAQLVKLAESSRCTLLNCDNLTTQLSVDECQQLAALPHLESLLLGTTKLRFDQLKPLMASPTLKSFMAAAVRAVSQAELEQLRSSIPDGCNRRLRVDYGAGISVGDVGLRRGG